jgi:hypothetical protein
MRAPLLRVGGAPRGELHAVHVWVFANRTTTHRLSAVSPHVTATGCGFPSNFD